MPSKTWSLAMCKAKEAARQVLLFLCRSGYVVSFWQGIQKLKSANERHPFWLVQHPSLPVGASYRSFQSQRGNLSALSFMCFASVASAQISEGFVRLCLMVMRIKCISIHYTKTYAHIQYYTLRPIYDSGAHI